MHLAANVSISSLERDDQLNEQSRIRADTHKLQECRYLFRLSIAATPWQGQVLHIAKLPNMTVAIVPPQQTFFNGKSEPKPLTLEVRLSQKPSVHWVNLATWLFRGSLAS